MERCGKSSRVLTRTPSSRLSCESDRRLQAEAHRSQRPHGVRLPDPQLWPFDGPAETLTTWLALFICGGGYLHAAEEV